MDDKQIRVILKEYLRDRFYDCRIYEERGIGSCICDVMLVSDCLIGFEIKSDKDNLDRLDRQIAAYSDYFDKNYLVIGERYRSVSNLPADWGLIWVTGGKVEVLREARRSRKASIKKQLSLLWNFELKNILTKNKLPSYAQTSSDYIIERIAESVSEDVLKGQIVKELRSRDDKVLDEDDFTLKKGGVQVKEISGLPVRNLIEALSEGELEDFSLADWMALYHKGKQLKKKKEEMEVEQARKDGTYVPYTDITVALGVPWISSKIIKDFVSYLLKPPSNLAFAVNYEPITGNWSITCGFSLLYYNREAKEKYGTKKKSVVTLLEDALNLREVRVYETDTKKVDEQATLEALEKLELIKQEFENWVWKDKDRRLAIEMEYNRMFGGFGKHKYDGSKLTFPGSSGEVELFPYQKDAVQKILSTPNTLLSFDVGAGKTYIMIAAAMEMRRMGKSRKNLFVVPNNIVGQWELMFSRLYPDAKILTIDPNAFRPERRHKVMTQMRDGDYDGIIIAYSCFGQIRFSSTYAQDYVAKKLALVGEEIGKVVDEADYQLRTTGRRSEEAAYKKTKLSKERETLAKMLPKMFVDCSCSPDEITFEQLGINTLFLDEAHNYKNLPIKTHLERVRGVNTKGSNKCQDMLMKVRCVQDANGGRGVVFATGTPLCNSISDTFVMQTYLQEKDMRRLHLDNFDNWVKTFAKPETICELDVTTANYRMVERFVRFHNLPELSRMFSEVSIFHAMSDQDLPDFEAYEDVVIERSEELAEYMEEIVERTEKIRAREVSPREDNMLKVSTDGRKAALDLTLVDKEQPYDDTSKIVRCVEKVWELYCRYDGTSQLIFCDNSTPKQGKFNVYSEIKNRLIEKGIPRSEIAFVHSCKDEVEKVALYEKVNSGVVRVLLGSTFKLGIGANVQSRLKAVHHLDVPWRPADMVQREGRILRRGNENKQVFIYRYLSEGSFDAYSWQILENKQRFITEFLCGSAYQRTASDLEDNVLTYAEAKALALSSPLLKEYAELENEVRKYRVLCMKEREDKERLKGEIAEIDVRIEDVENKIVLDKQNQPQAQKIAALDRSLFEPFCTIIENVDLSTPDKDLGDFFGFAARLPHRQHEKKPFCLFDRLGVSYPFELGERLHGNLIRLANFFSKFSRFGENFLTQKQDLLRQKEQCQNVLSAPSLYADKLRKAESALRRVKKQMEKDLGIMS